jgi:hypothetical protein
MPRSRTGYRFRNASVSRGTITTPPPRAVSEPRNPATSEPTKMKAFRPAAAISSQAAAWLRYCHASSGCLAHLRPFRYRPPSRARRLLSPRPLQWRSCPALRYWRPSGCLRSPVRSRAAVPQGCSNPGSFCYRVRRRRPVALTPRTVPPETRPFQRLSSGYKRKHFPGQ